MAKVTIGMPVFNGEQDLGRSIGSLLDQTFSDYRLIISDNASTDKTRDLCQGYASADGRIEYFRQKANIGAAANFRFVLDKAETPYFMWAAADDFWLPEFIAANLQVLEQNERLVSSVTKVKLVLDDDRSCISKGTKPLLRDPSSNIFRYLMNPSDNSRFYGLFRTDCLRASYPVSEFLALDWAVAAATLLHGGHYEVDKVLMVRSKTPTRRYFSTSCSGPASIFTRLFPLWQLTRHLVFQTGIPITIRTVFALVLMNVCKTLEATYYSLTGRHRPFAVTGGKAADIS